MSDENDSAKTIYGIAFLVILIVILFGLRACQEQRKRECRAHGGKVGEVHGEWFTWICQEK